MAIAAKMVVAPASRLEDVEACRTLVSEVYSARYGVTFTADLPDPHRKLEPWPDRWVAARVGGELVAAAGVYEQTTYVERFGGVTRSQIAELASDCGALGHERSVVEYTRLVVAPGWEGRGLGSTFLAVTHSRGFLATGGGATPLILACGKLSVFGSIYERAGIRSRTIAPFPEYASHDRYRSSADPMESRLIIPELDLDPIVHALQLPLSLDLALDGDRRVA